MSALKNWLDGDGATVLWVDFAAYAKRVFANSPDDWYGNPTRYASTLIQAQGVIPTQCLSVDVLASFRAGGEPASPDTVSTWLREAADGGFVVQALDALLHRFAGKLDVILKLDAPADLLGGEPDFDALDDVATAMTGFLREVADKPLAGVVIEKRTSASLSDDEIDACEPLIGAARHYDWITALSFPGVTDGPPGTVPLDLDCMLLPGVPVTAIDAGATGPRLGGGLDDAFWGGASFDSGAIAGRLLHGEIPDTAKPETVLDVLGKLGR